MKKSNNLAIMIVVVFMVWTSVFAFTAMSVELYWFMTINWLFTALAIQTKKNFFISGAQVLLIVNLIGFVMDSGPHAPMLIFPWSIILMAVIFHLTACIYFDVKERKRLVPSPITAMFLGLFVIALIAKLMSSVNEKAALLTVAFTASVWIIFYISWGLWSIGLVVKKNE